jgi:competence protein ComFB
MCQLDIIALALNDLPPNYAVSTEGLMYTKLANLKAQYAIDVVTAISKATKKIGENPRHELP